MHMGRIDAWVKPVLEHSMIAAEPDCHTKYTHLNKNCVTPWMSVADIPAL